MGKPRLEGGGDRPATPAQINKLLVMLSINGSITSEYDRDLGEWDYDERDAIAWLRSEIGIVVDDLSDLTHGQCGRCYEELE